MEVIDQEIKPEVEEIPKDHNGKYIYILKNTYNFSFLFSFFILWQVGTAKSRRRRPNSENEAGRASEIVEKNSEEIHGFDWKATSETG